MRSIAATIGLVLTLVACAARVDAAPITYEFSGIGSGAIGGASFTDAVVTYTALADTDDIVTLSLMGLTFYAVGLESLAVNIAGIGTATVTDLAKIVAIPQAIVDPDGDLPALPGLLLLRIDDPSEVSDMDRGTGMAAVFGDSLMGYDLAASIGPLGGIGGVGFIEACGTAGHDPCIGTSLGALSFTTNIETTGTFHATAEGASVPEPATLLLMGTGLAAGVRRSRRGGRLTILDR